MSETAPEQPTDTEGQPQEQQGEKDWQGEAEKWKALARKHEGTARANADAAKRLAEIEDANKTEQQKLAERAANAEQQAEQARVELIRYKVAAEKGVPADLIVGATEDELTAAADRLLAFRGGAPKPPAPDLKQGVRGSAPAADPNEMFRQFIRSR